MDTPARFTQEQQAFASAVREFCQRELGSREQRARYVGTCEDVHSPEFYARLAVTGYLGVGLPEEYGGSGGGQIEQCLLFEELWRGLAPAYGAGTSHTVAGIYRRFAGEEQKRRVLGAISAGTVMSVSISEPQAGSDAAGIACKAERVPGGYRVSGQKT
jgi:alkylation response protein AidB-like acyl-CoA dehydrogenase